MKKHNHKLLCGIMLSGVIACCALPLMGFTVSNGSDVGYSREFSELFAKTFLSNVTDSEIEITDVRDVYSFNETVYGSKVSFRDTQTEKDGYIIFSIDGHVNEYSLDGEPETLSDKDNKLYYNGDYTYFFKTKAGEYLNRFGEKVENLKNVAKNYFNKKLVEKIYLKVGTKYGEGEFIDDPESILPDSLIVESVETKFIDNYDLRYAATSFYEPDNNCGPTAVLNCIIYYDSNGFPALLESEGTYGNFYLKEFDEICELMNFKDNGATPAQQVNTLYDYTNKRYPNTFSKHKDYYVTHSDIEARTRENRPFIYSVGKHSVYGDHAVVGLGYKKFICSYKTSSGKTKKETDMFIRIADGWEGYNTSRYINFADASTRSVVWLTCK